MLKAQNIYFSYGNKEVLKDINIEFEKGSITSVIGPNGCGKTTLLNIISGITKTKNGAVYIDEKNLASMKNKAIAGKIAYLAQQKSDTEMTVRQLVLHGRFPHTNYSGIYSEYDKDAAVRAMEKLNILNLSHLKLNTLSGGMKQSAFIAMALCQETDYILLDEPTTYLDIVNQIKLMKLLKSLAREGKGIVSVLHDLPLALSFSDKIAVISDGRLMAYDTPENICSSGIIKTVFGVEINKSEYDKSYYFGFDK